MAKSTTKDRKLTQFPKSPDATEDPPTTSTTENDPSTETPTPFDPTPAESTEKPRKAPKTLTFFQRVASIDRADWGDRAKIKIYRLMPIINRLAGSEHKFVTIYGEPITEEKLKVDHGSGRYRLYLNYKTSGNKEEKEIDMVELDILDPAFPPKIPPGEWVDDPRNKQWAWARPAGAGQQPGQQQQPAADPLAAPLAAFGTFMDIQDRVEERLKPTAGTPATPVVDPWAAAEKILNMRSDNPMVGILQEQMKASAAAAEAERDRAFKAAESAREREFKLQEALMTAKTAPATPQKSWVDGLLELATNADKLEPIKNLASKLFGTGGGEAVRASKTTGMDILNNLVSGPAGGMLAQGIGTLLVNLPNMFMQPAANPANGVPPTQQPRVIQPGPQPPENPEQRIQRIGEHITRPMLGEFFMKNAGGDDFASWMYDGTPEDYAFIKSLGPENLVDRYRRFPAAWAVISYREADFVQFIKEFCAWTPESDEEEPIAPVDGVIDVEKEDDFA